MCEMFFTKVALTEIFPKATRMGLGLGGGSCKKTKPKIN